MIELTVTLTNPNDKDSDHDGLPDDWEIANLLNPNDATGVNGANGDPDGDGYTNLQEYTGGSNPRLATSKPTKPPVITASSPSDPNPFILEEDTLAFSATATDADGDTISYSWQVDGVVKSNTNTFNFVTDSNASGPATLSKQYTVVLHVTAAGDDVTRTWTVTVNNRNHAPVLQALNGVSVRPGDTIQLNPVYSDPDNQNTATGDDNVLTVTYADFMTTATKTVTFADIGQHSVTVTVQDNGNPTLSAQQTIQVNVNPLPPAVATDPAGAIAGTTATLKGTVNANGAPTTVTFEYGPTMQYGSTVTATQSPVGGIAPTAVTAALTGLTPGTQYHYHVVGMNSEGTTNGGDMSFTTLRNNANLTGLALSAGALVPPFAGTTPGYSMTVANAVSTTTVTPTVADSAATVTVNGSAAASGVASGPYGLNVGDTTFTTMVTAQDGTTAKPYTVVVHRKSADASLATLALSGVTLTPAFAGGTTSYTASVPFTTTSTTVTATASSAAAVVNGSTGNQPLSVGTNTLNIVVTAENGNATPYTVVVTRAAPSTNANLSGLALSAGALTPGFAGGTFSYTATVANAVASINVTPTVADGTATLKVNTTPVASGVATPVVLNVGDNPIAVLVTAQDGSTKLTYTVVVHRKSADATLAILGLTSVTLNPVFASGTRTYTAGVPYTTASTTVTATATNAAANVSGSTGARTLSVGLNNLSIVVTAEDGNALTYTVAITRAAPSTNANLSGLALSAGTLTPNFAAATTIYNATVANAIDTVSVTPTVADGTATVKVNGTAVGSGVAGGAIGLNVGDTAINVVVTAQDGSTKPYSITVHRKSADASLASLGLSAGTLSPAFASGTTAYTVNVPFATVSTTITAAATHAAATVSGSTGAQPLAVGVNHLAVVVTAEDGNATTYLVTITRAAGGVDAGFNPNVTGGVVLATALQPDGKIVIGGEFTVVGTTARRNLARLNADGTVDPTFDPGVGPDAAVDCVAVESNGKILVGGAFAGVGGAGPHAFLARYLANGAVDETFAPAPGAEVLALAVQGDGRIVIGGAFRTVNGQNRAGVTRLNVDGSLDAAFTSDGLFAGSGVVRAVAMQGDDKILLGGLFTMVNGQPRTNLARLNANGSLDANFTPATDAAVASLAVQGDGQIVVGGAFTMLNGELSNHLARLNGNGSLEDTATFDAGSGPNDEVASLAVQTDGKILLAGAFATVDGQASAGFARLTPDGRLEQAAAFESAAADSRVESIAVQQDGRILLAGRFQAVNGSPRHLMARLGNAVAGETLTVTDATHVQWQRGGAGPELAGMTFEVSSDAGQTWRLLGAGARVPGGWGFTGNLTGLRGTLRALGRTGGGHADGSSGLVAQTQPFDFDTANGLTLTPTLLAPAANSASKSPLAVSFTLPEPALPGSVTLKFGAVVLTLGPAEESAGTHAFTFDPAAPTAVPAEVASISGDTKIADGVVDVTLSYRDTLNHPAAVDTRLNVTIDTATQAPAFTGPAADSLAGASLAVQFTLPEPALPGSVQLIFDDGITSRTLTLAGSQETTVPHSFNFDPAHPTSAGTPIASGPAIPDGSYAVTLSYQDALGNAAATVTHPRVAIDTTPPTIAPPAGGFSPLAALTGSALADYAGQADMSDAHGVHRAQDPVAGTLLDTAGTQVVTLTATDDAGNSSTATVNVTVRLSSPLSTPLVLQGAAAPGHGTVGGPPDSAKLTSFGVPAIDDDGTVAFLGSWTAAGPPVTRGSGLFTQTGCVAKIGGPTGMTGVTFKTLADPVIAGGRIAFLSTLAGVPAARAGAVWSGPPAAVTLVAQAGDIAPNGAGVRPAGGATFKTFKAVAVEGESVAIFAQLAGGTGALKATAANDCGLWIKDATHPLTLVLREGQVVGNRTILTLTTFAVGNGSPGQGRGWLTQTANGPRVLALAFFTGTDKAQAVVGAGFEGGVGVLAQNNPAGTLPDIAGASFASYGMPTINADGKSAFLASLAVTPGGPATAANARGLFVDYGNPTYTKIARVTEPAGATGSTFSLLKDPVLAEDNGLAFPATLKTTTTVKGYAVTTLWWKTNFGPLQLLAQGGPRPAGQPIPGLPIDAQWTTFPSLAVGDRGPIFSATLLAGKGGVTAATANGVWAVDYAGATRLLIRTGLPNAIVANKTLQSFTLLKTAVGSIGVTRSFNHAGQLVWLATFTDRTTALITTEVP
ncbi:MAG TPA: cadherin-like beta sandwich domain-containing protein [Chthoniobacteraceae bacterium]|nr:cadherin-like beta sandwich domain-containing protein [Chthoniobacteraceae bacterium]